MSAANLRRQKYRSPRPSTIKRLELQDTITDRLKAYNAKQRWRKRLSWLSWIWRRA
ncbi:hypothetical protein [Rhizobium sp. 60-20]|mgnify:CR=1 FL=1|jgi:hypothetical protein|uniref:hypothetical protein n=1 Tax=Rhizobium sp. 60-20 TaxID=1895819 RepID=UPI000ACE94BB|nr:hypothetical protein [Rhizobium sp. 60-20]